jgi:hypothetical protein
MYVRLKHTHICLCMQLCIVNFNLLTQNMRNHIYAYKLVQQFLHK